MRGPCNHLIVLKVVSPAEAEIVFDGSGIGIFEEAGKTASNGQRRVSLVRLARLLLRRWGDGGRASIVIVMLMMVGMAMAGPAQAELVILLVGLHLGSDGQACE